MMRQEVIDVLWLPEKVHVDRGTSTSSELVELGVARLHFRPYAASERYGGQRTRIRPFLQGSA